VRFEAVAGEFGQHDFGECTVRYADGSRERIQFFASRLKFSRLVRVRLVADQVTETVCRSLVDAFDYFGGMPLISVFDNPRTIVCQGTGYLSA
jgi:transposase